MFELNREAGTTLVLVTHDESLAARCGRIVRLAGGKDRCMMKQCAGACWLRDWRAGELRVLAVALVIAVASVTSVAFFADRVGQALVRDAHQLLGADLVLVSDHPWQRRGGRRRSRAAAWQARRGDQLHQHGDGATASNLLAGVKAVTPATIRCAAGCASRRRRARPTRRPSAGRSAARCGSRSAWSPRSTRRSARSCRLGRAELEVAAVLTLEPERSANFFNIAPRLMMNADDVAATGLMQPGSRVSLLPVRRRRRRTGRALRRLG